MLAGAAAAAAAAAGMRCYVFVPRDLETAKIVSAAAYGATVVAVDGSYDQTNRLCSEIAEAYRRGLGVEAIARRVGLPVREVYWQLGRENVTIRPAPVARGPRPDTLELLRRLRRLRAEGCTYKEIARLCGIAPGTVGVMLSTFREVEL